MNKYLDIHPEVAAALAAGKPVVALESTIISHGMPYPQNVETALNVERIIRENGAVPATIAIIGGRLQAGLSPEEIEYFVTASVYQIGRTHLVPCILEHLCQVLLSTSTFPNPPSEILYLQQQLGCYRISGVVVFVLAFLASMITCTKRYKGAFLISGPIFAHTSISFSTPASRAQLRC